MYLLVGTKSELFVDMDMITKGVSLNMGYVIEFESKKIDELSKIEHKYEPEERTVHGLRVKDLIYNIIDHNSVISLWENDHENTHYNKLLWKGMAHSIPEDFLERKFKRVFSSVPETILEGDMINVEVYWE